MWTVHLQIWRPRVNSGEKPPGCQPPGEPPTNFAIPDPSFRPLPGFCMAERVQQTLIFFAPLKMVSQHLYNYAHHAFISCLRYILFEGRPLLPCVLEVDLFFISLLIAFSIVEWCADLDSPFKSGRMRCTLSSCSRPTYICGAHHSFLSAALELHTRTDNGQSKEECWPPWFCWPLSFSWSGKCTFDIILLNSIMVSQKK